jgi:hypothetical protein
MKTMKLQIKEKLHRCLNFKQYTCLALACFTVSCLLHGADKKITNTNSINRKPAAVEEEVLTVPLTEKSFFTNENIFAEDDAGVMKDMKASFEGWQKTEDFAKTWDLGSTGLYTTPTIEQKRKYLSQKLLRYADKRLSGEMRNAEEGSALHAAKQVEQNLHPQTTVSVSKNFAFKFKARVLQGKAIMEVKNPWVECNATFSASGKIKAITRKEFKGVGLATGAEYSVNDSQLLTYIDQQITDNVKARISNTQGNDADSRMEMLASFPFNL